MSPFTHKVTGTDYETHHRGSTSLGSYSTLLRSSPGYLDIVPNGQGYRHIALFSPLTSSQPIFLTEGEWEVSEEIKAVDLKRRLM